MSKTYYEQQNIGKAKYLVNFHDGKRTHKDGSPFFDVEIFKNKKDREACIKDLEKQGYMQKYV